MKIIKKAKERTAADQKLLRDTVSDIIERVRLEGDTALKEYNLRFDASARESLRVTPEEIAAATAKLTEQELADMKAARANIEAFAKAQRPEDQLRASDLLHRISRERDANGVSDSL